MPRTTLKFLADESLEQRIVLHLRDRDYNVNAISEVSPSMTDESVLKKANDEDRIIITNDKDFGDLIFLNKLSHKGVILLRFRSENMQNKIEAINMLLRKHKNKLVNNFVVVEDDRVRIR